eukprot:CAMPEP_0202789724 /NCGR_PEP_ID=MMETSP1388-20130828/77903_1 /ASSEMBLY_ACC=CAM_ASM_000864 /TAXON_ID=37098 /ORGANISM="Isochrysis sp, Strain CCMP1244" /LENGTH=107 /DNA_ID=CAMNT_0049459415 /DNA_START=32 /DNA_END=351 /DNA_ORIENTATION=-
MIVYIAPARKRSLSAWKERVSVFGDRSIARRLAAPRALSSITLTHRAPQQTLHPVQPLGMLSYAIHVSTWSKAWRKAHAAAFSFRSLACPPSASSASRSSDSALATA